MLLVVALLCLTTSLIAALGPKVPSVRPNGIVTYSPPTAGELDGAAFAKWIVAQANDNVKKMALKKGAYHVKPSGQSGSHIFLSSLNGVTIWMDGVNLTMTNPAYQAFQFYVCKNLTTYGPTIWWDTPGFSQATITDVKALDSTGQNFNITFHPDDGYNSSFLLDSETGSVNGDYTDPTTGRLQAGPGYSTVQGIATEGRNNSWTIPISNSYFLPIVGWKLLARGNFLFCNLIAYSNNTIVNDFTILNCGGFGFLSNANAKTTFNSLSIQPAPFAPPNGTQLPVRASSADGVHSTDDFVGPTFDSCLFTALDDDCIAIHGTLNTISSISNSLSISGSSSLISTKQISISRSVSPSSSTSTPTSVSWPCSSSSAACDSGPSLSPTQLPKVVSGGSTYNLLGCMKIASTENKIPISYSSGGAVVDNGMTIEECASKASGSAYFGLTIGVQCIWGASLTLTDYPVVPVSSCNSMCLGDSSESCGAENLLQVYSSKSSDDSLKVDSKVIPGEIIDPAVGSTSLWKYQGCYSYGFNGNLGSYASDTTLEGCADFCSSKGAPAMSLKYASYCYCGYMETCTTRYCDSLCQAPCVGNGSEACGSDYYSVVYSLGDDPPSSSSSSSSSSSTSASSSSSPSASSASSGQGPVTFVAPSGPVFIGAILRFYSSSGVWNPLGTAKVTKISGNNPTTITVDNMPSGVDVTSSWVNANQTGSGFSITNTQVFFPPFLDEVLVD